MTNYERTAVAAAKTLTRSARKNPADVWRATICRFTESPEVRKKPCPRIAFVGLYEAGEIKGVPATNGDGEADANALYVIEAVRALRKNPKLAEDKLGLWSKTSGKGKCHNGQMDVVISLWDEGMIVGS